MRTSATRAGAVAILLMVGAGCGHAMREPSPLSSGGAPLSPKDAPELIAKAEATFARRPDVAAVKRADELFLAAASADPKRVGPLVSSIRAKVWLIDHEPDRNARGALAASAVDAGQWCERRAPASAWCDYSHAVALALQAREKRVTAIEALRIAVDRLNRAAATNPRIDFAGPQRVLAIILLRAPAWPMGPGDPEAALREAQRAAALFPEYAPNQIVLAEAQAANGKHEAGRASAGRAMTLARDRVAAGDPDAADWVKSAELLADRR